MSTLLDILTYSVLFGIILFILVPGYITPRIEKKTAPRISSAEYRKKLYARK